MNPIRKPPYQIKECLRLASYLVNGIRLYSDAEIAERIGETPAWVANITGATTPKQPVSPITNYPYDTNVPRPIIESASHPMTVTYDAPTPIAPICPGSGPITNYPYDPGRFTRSVSLPAKSITITSDPGKPDR